MPFEMAGRAPVAAPRPEETAMGAMCWDPRGFRFWDLGFRVLGLRFGIQGLGFRILGFGFRVLSLGFEV